MFKKRVLGIKVSRQHWETWLLMQYTGRVEWIVRCTNTLASRHRTIEVGFIYLNWLRMAVDPDLCYVDLRRQTCHDVENLSSLWPWWSLNSYGIDTGIRKETAMKKALGLCWFIVTMFASHDLRSTSSGFYLNIQTLHHPACELDTMAQSGDLNGNETTNIT